jgi:hypothetical protein
MATEQLWFLANSPQPFKAGVLHPDRSATYRARDEVDRGTQVRDYRYFKQCPLRAIRW